MNIYYVVYEVKTITNDVYALLWAGTSGSSNGCWYQNNTNCWGSPNTMTLNNAGPQYTPYVMLVGLTRLYTTADVNDTGNIKFLGAGVNGNNFNLSYAFTGNSNNNYQMLSDYLVYQRITCTANAVDIYLTLNRQSCNVTCSAGIGEYADATNTCQSCTGNCYCCQTASTQCTACFSGSNRVLNGTTCICNPIGFYEEVLNFTCVACHYSCISCTSSTNASCISCDLTVQHRYLQGDACPCIDGYYDSGINVCTACDPTCLTCSGAGASACLSCNSSLNRHLSGSSCICNQFFYSNGTAAVCPACHYTCATCANNTYQGCITCNASAQRYFSTNSCICFQGYYDVGPNTMLCSPCDPTCLVCNGPLSTNCIMLCDITAFRALVGSQCLCITHYYQVASTCYACDITCENCTGGTDA